ncbi:DoxX family protein [Candidatus Woesearchaeota archaeon]|nr:DoxX family protein [Candidatus Woesearchaeota archaeon]
MLLIPLEGWYDIGLIALRLAIGIIFFYHGMQKLRNVHATADGLHWRPWRVVFLGLAELFVSITSILGFLTEIAGIVLAVIMLGALYYKIVVWKIPFSAHDKIGWEFDLLILAAALALLLVGAGNFSIDSWMKWWP